MIDEKDIRVGLMFQLPYKEEAKYIELAKAGDYVPNRYTTEFETHLGEQEVVYSTFQPTFVIRAIDFSDKVVKISEGEKFYDVDLHFITVCGKTDGVKRDLELSHLDECELIKKESEQVSHPSHYSWLKDLCGVEPIDICRHFDFAVGNALKYLMRKGKVDGNKTEKEKRVEDLRKAIFYIEDEIKLLENGKD